MGSVGALLLVWLLIVVVGQVAVVEVSGDVNYVEALKLIPMFFYAQRSGDLSGTKKLVDWRSNSGLNDGSEEGVDLVGGYYDAGDNVKFTMPMAFSVTMLSWAMLQHGPAGMPQDVYADTLDAIKWATDYFLKAHPDPQNNLLWVQVGIAYLDHEKWESPESMDTPRRAFKVDSNTPGSDVAAETAAAFAAASMLFKSTNSSYSQLLISHAKSLFNFADSYRGVYLDAIPGGDQNFYQSSGYKDELLWAAAWLYRATGEKEHLEYVVLNGGDLGGTRVGMKEFSWDNKYAGLQVLVSTDDNIWKQSSTITTTSDKRNGVEVVQEYMRRAEYFVCACMRQNPAPGDNVDSTQQGLIYVRPWNNLEYVTSAIYLLATYADHINSTVTCPAGGAKITREAILDFAKQQADYILGNNKMGMSYLVGFGTKYPQRVHHRGASIPKEYKSTASSSGSSFVDWKASNKSNPNILYGALVGGPDTNDLFDDDRDNYEQTEPTMTGTATMFGILARLSSSSSNGQQQQQQQPSSAGSSSSIVSVAHAVISSWSVGGKQYCRHRVVLENTSHKETVKDLRLRIDHLSARPFGLITQVQQQQQQQQPTDNDDEEEDNTTTDDQNKNNKIYVLPNWTNNATIRPRSQHTFVYVQQCAQAKITLLGYRT